MTAAGRVQAVVQRLLLTTGGELRGVKYRAALEQVPPGLGAVVILATSAWRAWEEEAKADVPKLVALWAGEVDHTQLEAGGDGGTSEG
jgi:hypothetical protein